MSAPLITTLWELSAASIVFGWLLSQIPLLRRSALACYAAAALIMGGTAVFGAQFGGLIIATLEPFGVMLPMLCLASTLRQRGLLSVPQITPWEKLLGAALVLIAMIGTLGLLDSNPYALFYNGRAPMIGAVALGGWALLRRQTHILAVVIIAQALWLLDIGSSNLYDHLSHVLLIPALTLSALFQGIRQVRTA